MKIKSIVFKVTETKTYEITISEENGYDMPETAKQLVDHVNGVYSQPRRELDFFAAKSFDESLVIDSYEINEED